MDLINQITLQTNPIVRTSDYKTYFNVSQRTACRFHENDRYILEKEHITFYDFFILYDAFPASNFNPIWITIKVPTTIKKHAKMCQNVPNTPKRAKASNN